MVLITIVTGAYKPTNITGGPHIVWMYVYVKLPNMSRKHLPNATSPKFHTEPASLWAPGSSFTQSNMERLTIPYKFGGLKGEIIYEWDHF